MGFDLAEAARAAVPTHDYKALRAIAWHGGGQERWPLGVLTIGPQGRALTTRCTVALAVASNQQTVNGTDLPCPGPHSLDLGPQWKWGGAVEGRARQVRRQNHL